jgi:peptidoglycan/xylan/chitin deacetylase (PgdA/CDA1 family)
MHHSLDAVSGNRKLENVPSVYYHSIVDAADGWLFRHLSCPVSVFESHLKALRWANFHSLTLHQFYEYMANGKAIPSRSVVLTFDDGYLDNWVYAYPLLKKYSCRGTIFVNPEFVDPSDALRPNLEDVLSKRITLHDLPKKGFLSWQEMREMERSGYVDIQSHGLTHTWYFCSDKIVDFHHPGDHYPWLAWNAHPERKYLWMTEDQQAFVPWGVPVYQHEKSLATRRYFQDEGLNRVLVDYVRDHGNENFFQNLDWRQKLEEVAINYRQNYPDRGRFESDTEYKERLYHELFDSKQMIEKKLDKTVDFLSWPGGGFNEVSANISREVGYLASTGSSSENILKTNRFGEDPSRWSRIFPPACQWSETNVEYKGGLHFICLLNLIRGSHIYSVFYKALRIPFRFSRWRKNLVRSSVN